LLFVGSKNYLLNKYKRIFSSVKESAQGPDIGHLMLSRNGIFSWCAMAVLMAVAALTLHASIPRASPRSAEVDKI
jgi:hypothetical protein